MRFINYLQNKVPALAIIGLTIGLTSCGSYQYVGQDTDGIYDSSETTVEQTEERVPDETATSSGYYQNYFKEKSQELELAEQENEIFTDIDSYQGDYTEQERTAENSTGYAAWGESSDDVTINIYNTGFNRWGWNRWNRWNRWNTGWGFNNWGWNNGFGYGWSNVGWNNWGWNNGFGWNDPFWCPPFYGNGFGNPYYGYGYYGRNGYRGLAYNSGRRGVLGRQYLYGRNSNLRSTTRSTRTRSAVKRSSTSPRTRGVRTNNIRTRPSSGTRTRPSSGTRTRPSSGTRTRPSSGTRVRPSSGTRTRPSSGTRTRPSSGTRTRTRATSPSRSSRSYSAPRSSGSSRSSSGGARRGGRRN